MGYEKVHALMQQGVDKKYFQSATLLTAADRQPQFFSSYGKANLDTVYDLASLTKVLATTTIALQLIREKKIKLTDPLAKHISYLKKFPSGKITVAQLLTHTSGLPAWRPFYQTLEQLPPTQRKKNLRQKLLTSESVQPAQGTVYSDLGFLLLQWLLEDVSECPLDDLFNSFVAKPLGLKELAFIDLHHPKKKVAFAKADVAPTEKCPWRKKRLQGEVHDDNAFSLGGVCGHAGLFGTAQDIHRFVRELVAAFKKKRSSSSDIFDPALVRQFLNWKKTSRALGWDRPAKKNSSTGRYFSPNSVGHLGFTGTSLWIDLDRQVWVILLTNRVYYGREPNPMKKFRPQLHNLVARLLFAP